MNKNTLFPFVALLIILFTSCSKSTDAPADPAANPDDNARKVLAYIKALGFPEKSIVEKPTEFIVEEDISFPKNMKVPDGKVRTEQYYTGSLVSAANVTNIRLFVDPSMTSMMAEINSAIAQWNNVANCNINWVVVAAAPYDVLITNANLGNGVCGSGTFPSGGRAGNLIRINKNYIAGNSFAQRARTICHELGHNVSFRHTNWSALGESSAVAVPGVGGTDALSLMNGGQCGSGATVLSAKDIQAAAALY
jgi:hypothetical protein